MKTEDFKYPLRARVWTSSHQCTSWGWGVQAVLGMNQKHILPWPKFLVFSAFAPPAKFFPPTYLHLLPPSYLPSHSYLPPTYLPTPTSLPPTSPHFALTPSSELGRAWSNKAKLGASTAKVEVAAKSVRAKLVARNGRAEVATKSERVEMVARITCLKRKLEG